MTEVEMLSEEFWGALITGLLSGGGIATFFAFLLRRRDQDNDLETKRNLHALEVMKRALDAKDVQIQQITADRDRQVEDLRAMVEERDEVAARDRAQMERRTRKLEEIRDRWEDKYAALVLENIRLTRLANTTTKNLGESDGEGTCE